jgi:Uma2 family endonuclease
MSLEKYESLIASGFFNRGDDVHFINGYLVSRMPESTLHGAICEMIRLAVEALLIAGWHVRNQNGLRIPSQASLPRPDLVVVRGAARDYLGRYPEPADAALVVEVANTSLDVEVANTSLDQDRAMAEIYAAGGVPVYWIVNLVDRQVEVYSDPGPSGYRTHEVLAAGHTLRVMIDGVEVGEIPVADILP